MLLGVPVSFPFPMAGLSKGLIQYGKYLLEPALQFTIDYLGTAGDVSEVDAVPWRHFQVGCWDATDADTANRAYVTFDFVKIDGSGFTGDWNSTDYSDSRDSIAAWCSAVAVAQQSRAAWLELRIYSKVFNALPTGPVDMPGEDTELPDWDPFAPMGPPVATFPLNVPGTIPTNLPPQCSISITEKTSFPKHWGRIYLPFPGSTTCTTKGLVAGATADALAAATSNLYIGMGGGNKIGIVPTTQVGGQPATAAHTIEKIQVDNVFDVIRRRRTRTATYRAITP